MLLTLTSTTWLATDLGFLLHKHPDRVQSFDLSFGRAHVLFPVATPERCTAALLVDVDPVRLVRGRRAPEGRPLEQYVNDRPYVASSFLSVAIGEVFGTAMSGRSRERQSLADLPLPFEVTLSAVPCRGGEVLLRRLFEPLGYVVEAEALLLDPRAGGGPSRMFRVRLRADQRIGSSAASGLRISQLLTHLYVLLPVLDDDKHYWVGDDEVDKLVRRGEGWLEAHPERQLITERYLKHRPSLARAALARLIREEIADDPPAAELEEAEIERPIRLTEQRRDVVVGVLKDAGAKRVLDLGCGEGQLLQALLADPTFQEIVGVDVSPRALEIAARRLHLDDMPDRKRARIRLLQSSVLYRDARLHGYDAAAVIEVIEHLDPGRLDMFGRILFDTLRPTTVIVTTPNAEHNVLFATSPRRFRHRDHRFEWTRTEFQQWAGQTAVRSGYAAEFFGIGTDDPTYGPPTQAAVFRR